MPSRAALCFLVLAPFASCSPAAPAPFAPPAPVPAPDAPLGAPVLIPQRIEASAKVAAISPDGTHLAVLGAAGVHLFEPATGVSRGLLPGCHLAAHFVEEGRAILAVPCEAEDRPRLWDLRTDAATSLTIPEPARWYNTAITPSGSHFVAAPRRSVAILDVAARRAVRCEAEAADQIQALAVAAGGSHVAVAAKREIIVCSTAGELVARMPIPWDGVRALALSSDGSRIAAGGEDGLILGTVAKGMDPPARGPCGDAATVSLAWAPGGGALAAGCRAKAQTRSPGRSVAVVADPKGAVLRELTSAVTDAFQVVIDAGGERVGVYNPVLGARLFALQTGDLVRSLPSTCALRSRHLCARPLWSYGMGRALVGGEAAESAVLVDTSTGAEAPRLPVLTSGPTLQPDDEGSVATDESVFPRWGMSLATGEIRRLGTPPSDVTNSPDRRFQLIAPGGGSTRFEIHDVAAGRERVYDSHSPHRTVPSDFSPRSAYVIEDRGNTSGGESAPLDRSLVFYDVRTGRRVKSFPCTGNRTSYAMSADEGLLALSVIADKDPDGRPCDNPMIGDCHAVLVHDFKTGRRLARVGPVRRGIWPLQFTADGSHLVAGNEVFDPRTGKLAWTPPEDMDVVGVVGRGVVYSTLPDARRRFVVVDVATGGRLREIVGAERLLAHDAAWALTSGAHAVTLVDVKTWTPKATFGAAREPDFGRVSTDGKLVYLISPGEIVIHRLSDGRRLTRSFAGGSRLDITDEGVLDMEKDAPGLPLIRKGPDVLASPMAPPETPLAAFVHPGLYADFVAGLPVGPKR